MISLETLQRKWASSRLEGRTSWVFSSCGRCSRLRTGNTGTRSGGLRKVQSPFDLLGGLSGFLSLRYRGLRPCVQSVPETEDSSPVLTCILGYVYVLVTRLCPTIWDPRDCRLPGSSVHGILQARILECIAISFSRGSSQPRSNLGLLHCRQILYHLSHQGSPY